MQKTVVDALKEISENAFWYGQKKGLFGRWNLRELAKFVSTFNGSAPENTLVRRRMFATLLEAKNIYKACVIGVGTYESQKQAERNGPMIPGPRSHLIELDRNNDLLVIKKRRAVAPSGCNQWFVEEVILLTKIRKIKIVRVPAGLRYLEIKLYTPCPD